MGYPKTNGTEWTRFDVGVSLQKIRDRQKRKQDYRVVLSKIEVIEE